MKTLYSVVALCALAFLLSGQSQEQAKNQDKSAPVEPGDRNRITLDVSRVNMLYSVSDKKGRFVTDLTKDDFEVFESKKHRRIRPAATARHPDRYQQQYSRAFPFPAGGCDSLHRRHRPARSR